MEEITGEKDKAKKAFITCNICPFPTRGSGHPSELVKLTLSEEIASSVNQSWRYFCSTFRSFDILYEQMLRFVVDSIHIYSTTLGDKEKGKGTSLKGFFFFIS